MKKYLFLAMLVVASVMAYAQPRAIGGRLGYGVEFSYEHSLGEANMISLEAGVPGFNGIEAACTYDWIDPFNAVIPWNEKGEWHWYMGVGGALQTGFQFNWGFIGAAGRFGVEYDFWFPLQLSLDWRPTMGVGLFDNMNGGAEAGLYWEMTCIALGVRYKF
jgi:hypothetical protein